MVCGDVVDAIGWIEHKWSGQYLGTKTKFPDALRFDPSRHLTTDGQLKDRITANHFAFGRGRCVARIFCCFNSLTDPCRRICPGMLIIHFAKLNGRWLAYDLDRSLVRRRCYVGCNNYDAFCPPLRLCQTRMERELKSCRNSHLVSKRTCMIIHMREMLTDFRVQRSLKPFPCTFKCVNRAREEHIRTMMTSK